MIYRKIGSVFRQLREERGYPLSKFSELGISKSTLSKFERGESMMSFDKVISALYAMGVNFEEFDLFINNYSLSDADTLFLEIERATFSEDNDKLKQLYDEAVYLNFPYIAMAAKASFSSLSQEETDEIVEYFYEIDFWGYKELGTFYLTMRHMNTSEILYLVDRFLKDKHNLFQIVRLRSYFAQICCYALAIFSYRGYKEFGSYILNQMESYHLINTMFLKNFYNLIRGYWIYCFENTTKGDEMMIKSLDIMHEICAPEIARFYQKKYNDYVKHA